MKSDSFYIPQHLIESISNNFRDKKTVPNSYFDRLYPSDVSSLSSTHWTPVDVAQRASSLLGYKEKTRILDIGSGCGKFCLVGALTNPQSDFFGIEQRTELNTMCRKLANAFSLHNTTFIDGDILELDWNEFDAFYFYNPFWENKMDASLRINSSFGVGQEKFNNYIKEVISKLEKLRSGSHIITYHGFGGRFPSSFECIHFETIGTDQIKLWIKK